MGDWKGKGIHRAVLAVAEIGGVRVLREQVLLGTAYLVDLTTRRTLHVVVVGAGEYDEQCVNIKNLVSGHEGYMPLRLLEIDEGCVEDASGVTTRFRDVAHEQKGGSN